MVEPKEILFEKFEIIECLKKDEHSAVYLANHVYLGKKIILKSLNTQTAADEEKIERFKREAKILAMLDHPNIIKVLDFGTYNEFFYISFEYFESRSLRYIIKNNNLSLTQKENLLVQLLKGLAFAHVHQIIHRDIKPENILVDDKFNLKLSDFGLALVMNENFVSGQFSLVGTPCYMSPEQVQGEQLTEKTDLFSAGIVLFELFKGFNPFLGGDINESFNKILEYDDNNISDEISDLPDNYKIILETLLKKEPSQRFKAAQSVLELLSFQEKISVDEDEREPERKKVNRALFIAGIVILSIVMLLLVSMEKERTAATEHMETDSTKITTGSDTPILVPEMGNLKNLETTTSKNNSNSNADKIADVINKVMAEEIKINEGELYIECLPWANVYINSTHVETTPISKNIVLPAGRYSVKLSHPEYPDYKAEVNIKEGETTNLSVNLESLFGYIDCKIYPWADVYINGTKKGSTPFQSPIKIAPGNYLMTIKNPNFKTKSKSITVKQGETLIIEIDLTSD
jgi:serine/threonine-protein kinase